MNIALSAVLAALTLAAPLAARADEALSLHGQCVKLTAAGRDMTSVCAPKVVITHRDDGRMSVLFSLTDGGKLEFRGDGAGKTEVAGVVTLPLQSVVLDGDEGGTTGTCRMHETTGDAVSVRCMAKASDGPIVAVFAGDGVAAGDTAPEAQDAATPAPAPSAPASVLWLAAPSSSDINAVYPDRAHRMGMGGRAEVDCTVSPAAVLENCAVQSEDPAGQGFAAAALSLAPLFHINPAAIPAGRRSHYTIQFVPND